MKILVIPDCHLKPFMFKRAEELLENGIADKAVYLGDTPDDFNCQNKINLYEETFDALISLVKKYPETLICYGNHDVCYLWGKLESGYSYLAEPTVIRKINALKRVLPDNNPIRFVHRIDNVLFCHGGICKSFVDDYVSADYDDADGVINEINHLTSNEMWKDNSPIWFRPQDTDTDMYKSDEFLQIVGHTPMEKIERTKNVISCDVFSTYPDGTPAGTREYLVIDTKTWEYTSVR